MSKRGFFLTLLVVIGVVLAASMYRARVQPPVGPTFTSAFQLLGETVRVADRLAGRVMPVDDIDEAALGEALRSYYDDPDHKSPDPVAEAYVNAVLATVAESADKNFPYQAYLLDWDVPNAMALPGGVIFVTSGLLESLEDEAQLSAVLAHEVGHIELSHCLDAVKFELAARKIGAAPLGELADLAARLMVRHAFSKTQEHEADVYAWTWLVHSRYDPRGAGGAFAALDRWNRGAGDGGGYRAGLLRDYFSSHPPLEIRESEFRNRAERWWESHPTERRYVGHENLVRRRALANGPGWDFEWTGPA